MTTINIPSNVTVINNGVFNGCSKLGSITIPNSVVSIGANAFSQCSGLSSISIPNSVTKIGDGAFRNCSSVKSIELSNSITSISGKGTFSGCSSLESIVIPQNITKIIYQMFMGCTSLKSVILHNNISEIGSSAFGGCTSLASIELPTNLQNIGMSAFKGCTALAEITIPNAKIEDSAFLGCTSLKSVTIGSGVTQIGITAFAECKEMTDVYCRAENVPTTESTAFEGSYPNYMTLHVPAASISSYASTAPWSSFGTIKSIDNSIATLSVTSGNGGVVTIGQTTIKENTTSVYVKKNNQTEITITPDSDFAIDKVLLDGNDVTSQVVNGNLSITLTADATLTVSFKLTATECTVTMTDDIATFCCAYDLDFTNVSGLKSYLAGGYDKANGKVMLMRVNSVPAGTGLILMGEAGTYKVPYSTSTAFYTNLLKGVTASTTINPTDGSNTNFILANGTNGIGFYAVSSSGELAAGKAYLQLPTSAAQAKSVKMVFEDETTGIVENYEFENKNNDGTVYDLMGRKVKNMTKGMYIMNGKKVIIK